MPGAILGTLYPFIMFNPHTLVSASLSPFIDEETEAGDYVPCPRSPGLESAECLTCSSPSSHAAHEGS